MMTVPLELDTIAARIRATAPGTPVALDTDLLPAAAATAIATAFGLPAGTFPTLTGVPVGDLPDPAPDPLTFSGAASLLRLADVTVDVALHASGTVVVAATMGDAWSFTDSFPSLSFFPFDSVTLTGTRFVYTNVGQAYPWPGEPSTTVELAAGLNLLATAGLGGFPAVSALLGAALGDGILKLYGPFGPTDGVSVPVGTLRAPLSDASFSVGVAPDALTLTEPAVAVQVTAPTPDDPVPDINLLVQGVFQNRLTVAVSIPATADGSLAVRGTPLPGQGSILTLIESLPGGADFTDYIPTELADVFSDIQLDSWSLVADTTPAVTYLGLAISTTHAWPLIPGALVLDGLTLGVEVISPTDLAWTRVQIAAQAQLLPDIFTEPFDFSVGLQKTQSWEVGTITGSYHGTVTLADLIGGLDGALTVPDELRGIAFSDFGVEVTRAAPGQSFTYAVYGNAELALPLLGTELLAYFNVSAVKKPGGFAVALEGTVLIGDESFGLVVDLGADRALMRATWRNDGAPLGFTDVVNALGWTDPPALPAGVDLALTAAGFEYDFGSGTLVLTATSEYGQLVFATAMVSGARAYLLDVSAPLGVRLSDLPVAGAQIPAAVDVGVDSLRISYGSAPFTAELVTGISATLAALGAQPLGFPELPAGLRLDAALALGGATEQLVLTTGASA